MAAGELEQRVSQARVSTDGSGAKTRAVALSAEEDMHALVAAAANAGPFSNGDRKRGGGWKATAQTAAREVVRVRSLKLWLIAS
jgi:hypothetical protein